MKCLGFLVLLALFAVVKSDKPCKIEEVEIQIPDSYDCEAYVEARAESFRFPSFPWVNIPPFWPPSNWPNFPNFPNFPNWPWPTTPMPDSDEDPDSDKESCPEDGEFKIIAHPENCDQFILCIGEDEITLDCPDGYHFSRKERTCIEKADAGCEEFEQVWKCPEKDDLDELVFLPNTEDCSQYFVCFGGQPFPLECGEGLHWSIDDNNCVPEDEVNCKFGDDREECPDVGLKRIPHPDTCEKFVICANGNRIKQNCPDGFHFSPNKRECLSKEIAGCDEDYEEPMCPEEDDLDNLIFHPSKEDCSMYYVCFNGELISLFCPEGLHWSKDHQTCLPEVIANCQIEKEEDDDKGREECPDTGVKTISHPDNCEKYVLCMFGQRVKRGCPEGLHFSRETRTCVSPEEAECEAEFEMTCPETDDADNIIFYPHPEDCSRYYVCFTGQPFPLMCPQGTHWSVAENTCLPEDKAGCKDPGLDIEECPETGVKLISHPENCEKYILCVNGMRFKQNCAVGLNFSRKHRNCVEPDIAECEDNIFSCPEEDDLDNLIFHPNTEDCSSYFICFGGEKYPLSCSDGLHWNADDQKCQHPDEAECPFDDAGYEQCPDTGVAQISHPDNCEKYVLCVGSSRIKMNCAPGMHFSRELGTCVPAHLANCEDEDEEEGEEVLSCPLKDDFTDLVFLPSSDDCQDYYLCFGGEKVPLSCADGLHWNNKDEMCMKPEDAGCK